MRSPNDIIAQHAQQFPDSCVPWGLEFILKAEEKISLEAFPLQTKWPSGCGFGAEEKQVMEAYGIVAHDDAFELSEFEKKLSEEFAASRIAIFTVPDHLRIDWIAKTASWVFHTWAAVPAASSYVCLSRAYDQPSPLPPLPLSQIYAVLRASHMPDWRIHTLWYEKK